MILIYWVSYSFFSWLNCLVLLQVNMKFKVADRIVVVTTSAIIKLDNKYKVMKTIPLDKVS